MVGPYRYLTDDPFHHFTNLVPLSSIIFQEYWPFFIVNIIYKLMWLVMICMYVMWCDSFWCYHGYLIKWVMIYDCISEHIYIYMWLYLLCYRVHTLPHVWFPGHLFIKISKHLITGNWTNTQDVFYICECKTLGTCRDPRISRIPVYISDLA